VDESKNLNTEINQLKKVNEKLNDRVDYLQAIIEKEASANVFYYNYPPKADETLKTVGKEKKADNEGQKVKKMYEDMMEQ
jgi:phage-related protein